MVAGRSRARRSSAYASHCISSELKSSTSAETSIAGPHSPAAYGAKLPARAAETLGATSWMTKPDAGVTMRAEYISPLGDVSLAYRRRSVGTPSRSHLSTNGVRSAVKNVTACAVNALNASDDAFRAAGATSAPPRPARAASDALRATPWWSAVQRAIQSRTDCASASVGVTCEWKKCSSKRSADCATARSAHTLPPRAAPSRAPEPLPQ